MHQLLKPHQMTETHYHLIPERPWPQNDCDLEMTLTMRLHWPKWWHQYHKLVTANKIGVQQSKKLIQQSDLDLDPVTLTLNLNLDMVKMYHPTTFEVSGYSKGKKTQTDRPTQANTQTDAQEVWKHYLPTYMGSQDEINILNSSKVTA